MKTSLQLLTGTALVCAMATLAVAQPPPRGERERPAREGGERERRGPAIERLDLEPAEREAVRELAEQHRSKMEGLMTEHRAAMERVRDLMQVASTTETELVNAAESAGRMQTQIQIERMRHFVQLREALGHEKALQVTLMWRERVRDGMRDRMRDDGDRPGPGQRGDRPPRRGE